MIRAHLENIQQIFLSHVWEINLKPGINDRMQLCKLVGDALKWCPSIGHAIQDAPQRPHITFRTDLRMKTCTHTHFNPGLHNGTAMRPPKQIHLSIRTHAQIAFLKMEVRFTFEVPGLDEVSLMASGGM